MRIVVLGLSITSSWGNGHATTWRALIRALSVRGHRVTFLERDQPWYADNRDMPEPPFCRTHLYDSLDELEQRHAQAVAAADLVIVGSYVPDGIAVIDWVLATARGQVAFYDIDTPVTLAKLDAGDCGYLSAAQMPRFDLYFSFTGGPTLDRLARDYGVRRPRALYCSVDPEIHKPIPGPWTWDLGYLGTYSPDRQPMLDRLLTEPARRLPDRRFAVAGPQYPDDIRWPGNVEHIAHLGPDRHRSFYCAQRFTLNVTRADMTAAGWSPSVRLFEAAACGVAILSDRWEGLDTLFAPDREILIRDRSEEVVDLLQRLSDAEVRAIGARARARILSAHTSAHRAQELERQVAESAVSRRAVPA